MSRTTSCGMSCQAGPANIGPTQWDWLRDALEGATAHHLSIAQAARDHDRSREHWSKYRWTPAVGFVVDEFVRREENASRLARPGEAPAIG